MGTAASVQSRTIPGLDLSDLLLRRFDETEDFVVLKLDAEGAEYDLIPSLIATGATRLIDEAFIELHTDVNTVFRHQPEGHHRTDALRLCMMLRSAGVYAHEWR